MWVGMRARVTVQSCHRTGAMLKLEAMQGSHGMGAVLGMGAVRCLRTGAVLRMGAVQYHHRMGAVLRMGARRAWRAAVVEEAQVKGWVGLVAVLVVGMGRGGRLQLRLSQMDCPLQLRLIPQQRARASCTL